MRSESTKEEEERGQGQPDTSRQCGKIHTLWESEGTIDLDFQFSKCVKKNGFRAFEIQFTLFSISFWHAFQYVLLFAISLVFISSFICCNSFHVKVPKCSFVFECLHMDGFCMFLKGLSALSASGTYSFFVCFHLTFIVFCHNFCCIIHNGQVFYSWSCNPANKVLKVNWTRHQRNCYISKAINQFYTELLELPIYRRIFCGVTAEIGHPGFLH